jgi:hypothetical protein
MFILLGLFRSILQFSDRSRVVSKHALVDVLNFPILELHRSVRTVSFSPRENPFN